MSTSTSTKILRYKVTTEGFDKLYQQIQNVVDKQNLKLPKSLETSLEQYKNTIQNIYKILGKDTKDIDDSAFEHLDRMLKSIDTNAGSFLDKFATLKLPKELLNSLKEVNDEISNAQKRLRALNAGAAKLKGFVHTDTETGQQSLTKKGYAEAFRQHFDAKQKKERLNIVSGSQNIQFSSFKELWDTADSYEALSQQTALQKKVIATRNEIKKLLDTATVELGVTFVDKFNKQLETQEKAAKKAQQEIDELRSSYNATNKQRTGTISTEFVNVSKLYDEYFNSSQQYTNLLKTSAVDLEENSNAEIKHQDALEKKNKTLMSTVASAYTYHTALSFIKRTITEATHIITNMDRALTGMSVVTSMSRQETWGLVSSFQSLAKETGKTTTEIADMATKFYQQGKNTKEVLELTEAAAKAATIAGIDGAQSIDLLTNAMNGFQLSSSQAMEVSDKFAALAAASATDYEELATALSKVAAQANLAGMSIDFTLGMLAKGIEVTREAPETIGTALKTVISRMRELTDYGKTLEDNMDVNRVAQALGNVGIELMDKTTGQFRDLEEVFAEIGNSWDTLNKNQQANIAIAMAGTRQQSRFIAMMQDFDRTLELVNISSNSYGATLAQQAKYMEGMEAKMTLMKNAWEELLLEYVNSDAVIFVIERITEALEFVSENIWIIYGVTGLLLALGAKRLIQTQRIKQAEFEINKIENERALLEKQREIERFNNNEERIKQEKIKQAMIDEEAALQLAKDRVEAKSKELIAAEQLSNERKIEEQRAKNYVKELRRQKKLYKQTLLQTNSDKKQVDAIVNDAFEQDIADAIEDYNKAQDATEEADKKVATAKEELEELNNKLITQEEQYTKAKDKYTKQAQEEYDLEKKKLNLDLQRLKLLKDQYTWSMRNLLIVFKNIKAKYSAWKANKKEKQSVQTETDELKRHTQAQREDNQATQEGTQRSKESTIANQEEAASINNDSSTPTKKLNWKSVGKKIAGAALIALGSTIIVQSFKYATESWQKYTDFIEYSTTQLEKLQVDLYNAQQEHADVKKLADEYDELASKISISADEATRLKEIAEEINNTAGREVVNTSDSYQAQLAQIRGYERSKKMQKQNVAMQMQEEVGAGMENAAYGNYRKVTSAGIGTAGVAAGALGIAGAAALMGASIPVVGWIVGGVVAAVSLAVAGFAKLIETSNDERAAEYRNFLVTSQIGQQTLRTIAQNNVAALSDFTATQSKELENIFISMAADKNNATFTIDGGITTDIFENLINENKESIAEFYNADSFVEMWEALDSTTEEFQSWAGKTASSMGILSRSGKNCAVALDNLGLTVEDFMNFTNNITALMADFGMNNDAQQKVLSDITNILANDAQYQSTGSKMNAIKDVISSQVKVTDEQYKAALNKKNDIESGKLVIEQGGTNLTYTEVVQKAAHYEAQGKQNAWYATDDIAARDQYNAMLEESERIIQNYKEQGKLVDNLSKQLNQLLFPIEDANNFAESLIKISSASERLTKSMNELDTMTTKDKLELIADYPSLATDILKGSLNAAKIQSVLVNEYNNSLSKFNISNERLQGHLEALRLGISKKQFSFTDGNGINYDFNLDNLEGMDETSIAEAQKIVNAMQAGMDSAELVTMMGGDISNTADLSNANNILSYAQQIIELGIVRQDLGESYLEYVKKANAAERENFFNNSNYLTSEINLLKTRLELTQDTEESGKLQSELNKLYMSRLQSTEKPTLDALKKELEKLAVDEKGNNYLNEWISKGVLTITEQGLQRDASKLDELSEESRTVLETFYASSSTVVEKWQKELEEYYTKVSEAANNYIDELKNAKDKENDILKERRESYEEYFDAIDALEEEQDRRQSQEDIVKQLSALSTGIDGNTKSKIKDLQSQLNDLMEEEAEARKEAAREALLESIDDKIDSNTASVDKNTSALNALTAAMITGTDDNIANYFDPETGKLDWESILEKYSYDKGGYVTHTGLAYVHGSPNKPEAFISAEDTNNIRNLLDMFDVILHTSIGSTQDVVATENINNDSTVVVENITIQTQQMNNNQDFRNAGNILAHEFSKIIQERGLNVNVKK